jgi:hypothetical protein
MKNYRAGSWSYGYGVPTNREFEAKNDEEAVGEAQKVTTALNEKDPNRLEALLEVRRIDVREKTTLLIMSL